MALMALNLKIFEASMPPGIGGIGGTGGTDGIEFETFEESMPPDTALIWTWSMTRRAV